MAYWIIDDHGFGGTCYRCSECGESFCDIFEDVGGEDNCPSCGALINEDENEYYKNGRKETDTVIDGLTKCNNSLEILRVSADSKRIQDMEERIHILETVSGYSVNKLIELFAAGYTLNAPEYLDMKDVFITETKEVKNIIIDQRIEE